MCFYYSSLLFKSTTMYLPWFEKSGGQDKRTLSQHSEQLLFTLGTEKHPLNRKHVFLLRSTDHRANTHTSSLTTRDGRVLHPHSGDEETGRAPDSRAGGRWRSPLVSLTPRVLHAQQRQHSATQRLAASDASSQLSS